MQRAMHKASQSLQPLAKPHARLTEAEVVEIYRHKADGISASKVCVLYGINDKTVRDIWTGRTWVKETAHLDPTRSYCSKSKGRPKGCKDEVPRKKTDKSHPLESDVRPSKISIQSQKVDNKDLYLTLMDMPQSTDHDQSTCPLKDAKMQGNVSSLDDQIYEWNEEGSGGSLPIQLLG
jgi:hypothetical protein